MPTSTDPTTAAITAEPGPGRDQPPGSGSTSTGHRARLTISIDGTDYRVRPVGPQDLPSWAFQAFTLTRPDPRLGKVTHWIGQGLEGPRCSCEDQQYRQAPASQQCKHLRAAQAVGLF